MNMRFGKLLSTVLLLSLAPLARAEWQPGLLGGIIPEGFNRTDLPTEEAAYLCPHAATNNSTLWNNATRTWVYRGQIYLDGGPYVFTEAIDDNAMLKIDGKIYLHDTDWGNFTPSEVIRLPKGWHDFDLRLGNNAGGAGASQPCKEGFKCAFGMSRGETAPAAMSDCSFPADPGDGTLFRHDDGQGFPSALVIQTEPKWIGAPAIDPATDVEGLVEGDTVKCSAKAAVLNGTHYRCIGHVLETFSGNGWTDPVTNLDNASFTYTHGTEGKRITWLYEADGYRLDASVLNGEGCTLTASHEPDIEGGFYSKGAHVTLKATAAEGMYFTSWLGTDSKNDEIVVEMDQPRQIQAVFGAPWSFNPTAQTMTDGNWVLKGVEWHGTVEGIGFISARDKRILNLQTPVFDEAGTEYKIRRIGGNSAGTTFEGLKGLVYLFLPDEALINITGACFKDCTDLETVSPLLPDSLESIGSVFEGCTKLRGVVRINNPKLQGLGDAFQRSGVTGLIAPYLKTTYFSFDHAPKLEFVCIPAVEEIGNCSFNCCSMLRSVELSENLKVINRESFYNCPMLEKVTPFLPDSVTRIDYHAFAKCNSLEGDLVLGNSELPATGEGAFSATSIRSAAILHCPVVSYQSFSGCREMREVTLPPDLQTVAGEAFYSCMKLARVAPFLPDTVTTVGKAAFHETPSLKGPLFLRNKGIGALEADTFRHSGITSADLSGVTELGNYAFGYCPGLSKVVFGDAQLNAKGEWIFYGIAPGASFYFPRKAPNPEMGQGAFNCADRNNRYRLYGSKRLDPDGWALLTDPLTEEDRSRDDFPGKKTFGTFDSAGNRCWLVDWRSPREPKGTVLLLR